MKEYINVICTEELVLLVTETNVALQCEECYEKKKKVPYNNARENPVKYCV